MEDNKKLGQSPAFASGNHNPEYSNGIPNGMNIRFYAACAAMQGLIAGCDVNAGGFDAEWTAKAAFNMADKLLEQENL